MFRRRRPPPLNRPARGIGEPELIRTHELFERGLCPEAALIFDRIAWEAKSRGGPWGYCFYPEVGRAWVVAGKIRPGMPRLAEVHRLVLEAGCFQALRGVLPRLETELVQMGLCKQARTAEWAYCGSVLRGE